MLRSINHFSLHRINSIELRVVSDVAEGVLPVIQAEESVVRKYSQLAGWPHRWITLFVLEDLQPLLRQLRQGARPASLAPSASQNLSASDIATLSQRPVVNVYDLADLSTCNVFVNRQEMITQHYWEDVPAMRGLLAHEHAHPLTENEITRASRQIHFQVLDEHSAPLQGTRDRLLKITQVLALLGEKLSLLAPREILANEMTIQCSFSKDLLHLNLRNLTNASGSIAGRTDLVQQLQQEVAQDKMSEEEMGQLLLVGDLNAFLPLAIEIAPFYRAGKPDDARALEQILETSIFPYLDPLMVKSYMDLQNHYRALPAGSPPLSEIVTWSNQVLQILCGALIEKNISLQYKMRLSEN